MSLSTEKFATVNENGEIVLPAELAVQYGLLPGSQARIEVNANHLRLHRPVTQLNKVYVEPTNLCNLDCVTCMRYNWDENLGRMSEDTFQNILAGLQALAEKPTVFFGGLGEPLFHPRTVEWIAQAKAAGCKVELITNGTTLTPRRSRQLIEAELDVIWLSLDGATPESYADVRLGAELPKVIENIQTLRRMRPGGHWPRPVIGVAFVAMKRNIQDLPEIIRIGRSVGAKLFSISNVMPYTEEMLAERLYTRTMKNITYMSSAWLPSLNLPKMDFDETTQSALFAALNSGCSVTLAGSNLSGANDVCNFIESGTMTIAWDGGVSPCWPLMHSHVSYLHGKPRHIRRHVAGNVNERGLSEIWLDEEYVAYRQKVQGFGFAPCTFCGGCDLSQANEEDCLGNSFPACGGCLWSQGVIQCP
jgi:MoaA/NifB/PqqE/SkfB family radical SAM enzyme